MRELVTIPAPNLVVICINRVENGEYSGTIHNRMSLSPIPFSSAVDMVIKMDQFYNEIRFPQATLKHRSFLKNGSQECAGIQNREFILKQEAKKIVEQRGDVATFVVHVQHRQNATWQGKIIWAEKQQELAFRSALEMLRMMDQAVNFQQTVSTSEPENSEE